MQINNSSLNTSLALKRYTPQATPLEGVNFSQILQSVGRVAGGTLGSTISSGIGGVPGVPEFGDFQELLSVQIEAQKEMQSTSMLSNIEKSKHETKMSPIRNIRV